MHADAPARALLGAVQDAELVALPDAEACCGFGGLFSVQMPQISTAMGERKAKAIEATGAELVVTGETGCVLQMAGLLSRRGSACRSVHLAELLAGKVADRPVQCSVRLKIGNCSSVIPVPFGSRNPSGKLELTASRMDSCSRGLRNDG